MFLYIQPLYIASLGANPEQIGLTLASSGLMVILLYIPIGLWADRRGRKPVILAGWFLGWLLPPITLAAALAGVMPIPALPAGIATALSAGFWMVTSRGMRIPARYGLLYPAGAALALWIVLRSSWRGSRLVEWKDRTYAANGARSGGVE